MRILRIWLSFVLLAAFVVAFGQSWSVAYDSGLKAARALNWHDARANFKQAAAYRPEDVASATLLPGPPTAQKRWRDGAPYSPNFLAAYAGYREAISMKEVDGQMSMLNQVASEFETLLAKNQVSKESYFVLSTIYGRLNDQARLAKLKEKYAKLVTASKWKVDSDVIAPEEMAAMSGNNFADTADSTIAPTSSASLNSTTPEASSASSSAGSPPGAVPIIPTKFALIVGNQTPKLGGGLPFAVEDATRVRDALVNYAGYDQANTVLLLNVRGDEILSRAKAMATKIPDGATVLIYFAGIGQNVSGRDYLAGSDTSLEGDTSTMVAKLDLYSALLPKGPHIFAFFEANRQSSSESYFGSEVPIYGSISQMQGTIAGENVLSNYVSGKLVGIYANAFVTALSELKSNKMPILEFAWQVFNRMRRGDSGTSGGSSHQVCTLPYLNNLASDSRF